MKRLFCTLLILVLLISALPLAAAAAEPTKINGYDKVTIVQQPVTGGATTYVTIGDKTLVYNQNGIIETGGIPGFKLGQMVALGTGNTGYEIIRIAAHTHEFEWIVNRDGHFYRCKCGDKMRFQEHVMGEDGKCHCGYVFMDNADLTVLWMSGIKLSPSFKKDVTEYEGKLMVKDLEKTKISAFSFDAKATVELPEDLTLKKGTNTFEIKITAEDGKTTKTYTVTVEKE